MSDIQVTVVVDEPFATIQSGTLPATGGPGGGDVTGPGSAADNAIARFNGTTGKLIQSSAATLDDDGNLTTPGTVNGRDLGADGLKLDSIEPGPTLSDIPAAPLGDAAAGTSDEASRADHVHAHGAQGGGSLHATATTAAAGFMSAADKLKLDGLSPDTDPRFHRTLLLAIG